MAEPFANPTPQQLAGIFDRAFRADPTRFRRDQSDLAPIEDMLGQSPALNLIRENLPNSAGDTKAVQWLNQQLPENWQGVKNAMASIPLGGYSAQEIERRRLLRQDPEIRRDTVLRGEVPVPGGDVAPTGDSFRAAAAQNLGVVARDVATDGLRNIWWFLNAPQAVASIATLQALHNSGLPYEDPALGEGRFLKSRGLRLAATVPAVIGMSMAVGNYGRQPGYTAAVPSEADKTQSADPLAEVAARYVLGRTGSLLPYDEFVKERPDVSKGEYQAYKAYLHGNSLPLKATMDGINGPEVTFLGKSIPVLTGILPAVAAVAGTAYGVRKAGRRMLENGAIAEEIKLKQAYGRIKGNEKSSAADVTAALGAYRDQHDKNQGEILKQALLYSSGGLAGAALAGQTLELLRRSLKGDVAAAPEATTQAPAVEVI